MGKIAWVDKWHAVREAGNPVYKGLGFRDRLKAEIAYRAGKGAWGVTDEMGQALPKGSPQYEAQKQHDREKAREIAERI